MENFEVNNVIGKKGFNKNSFVEVISIESAKEGFINVKGISRNGNNRIYTVHINDVEIIEL